MDIHWYLPIIAELRTGLIFWKKPGVGIQPLVGSFAYEVRKQELIEKALACIRNLPVTKTEKPGMGKEQGEEIKLILTAFQHKFIPEMLLDVALIKAMLDGKEAASSRFSVAG